eukprot:TRINITY_DN7845_c0_g1_i2.p1 TRINITY_DN7845_c0_g1~~TRINITY_DN7845_c0_g1_i2.p1  ORF type:complete len:260 (+),score=23.36 TRINITY_DN7845_c0_g1_i2:27-806(+)
MCIRDRNQTSPFTFHNPTTFSFSATQNKPGFVIGTFSPSNHDTSKDNASRYRQLAKIMNKDARKNRLVRQCLKKVKDNRRKILDEMRQKKISKSAVKVNMHDLINMEWAGVSASPDSKLSREEYEELMVFLEQALYEDIKQEEQLMLEEFERFKREEQENFNELIMMSQTVNESTVICPVCRTNPLQHRSCHIFCSCGTKINTKNDQISLDHLRNRLCALMQQHSLKCKSMPNFENRLNFGISTLCMSCRSCNAYEVVI